MRRIHLESVLAILALAFATAACGSQSGGSLLVGDEPDSGGNPGDDGTTVASDSGVFDPGDASASLSVSIILQGCTNGCATVKAVVSGGNPPYQIQWDDGSHSGDRQLCAANLDGGANGVTVTDTASQSGEIQHAQETASSSVPAAALRCDVDASGGPQTPMVYWAKWTSPGSGSASGVMSPPSGAVTASYKGELEAVQGSSSLLAPYTFTPPAAYTSATVTDAPPSDMVLLTGGNTDYDTLTFSRPVRNPVFAVYSLGSSLGSLTAKYDFDQPFVILSTGKTPLSESGQSLVGTEGDGVIQFTGTFTTIRWKNTTYENLSGFNIGIRDPQ